MSRFTLVRIVVLLAILGVAESYQLVQSKRLGAEARVKADTMAAGELTGIGLDTRALHVQRTVLEDQYYRIEYRKTEAGKVNALELWFQTEDPARVRLINVDYAADAQRDPESALARILVASIARELKTRGVVSLRIDPTQLKTALAKSS